MRQIVGFSQKIKRAWLDAILDRLTITPDEAELRNFLHSFLKEELPGPESRAKSVGIVMRIWTGIPPQRASLRDRAVALLPHISGQERIWLHWGMTALAYPFFRDVSEVVGRLLALQDDFTLAQVQTRLLTAWGDRTTCKEAAQKLISALVEWEVLRSTKAKGHFLLARKMTASTPELQLWLLEALLSASQSDEIEAQQLLRLPESFPFTISIGVADLRKYEGFNIHRQGLDMDMVAVRPFRTPEPRKSENQAVPTQSQDAKQPSHAGEVDSKPDPSQKGALPLIPGPARVDIQRSLFTPTEPSESSIDQVTHQKLSQLPGGSKTRSGSRRVNLTPVDFRAVERMIEKIACDYELPDPGIIKQAAEIAGGPLGPTVSDELVQRIQQFNARIVPADDSAGFNLDTAALRDKLKLAATCQAGGEPASFSCYATWGSTIRDHLSEALRLIRENQDRSQAEALLIAAHDSMAAYSELQVLFDMLADSTGQRKGRAPRSKPVADKATKATKSRTAKSNDSKIPLAMPLNINVPANIAGMKALSIRQPNVEAIFRGIRTVEHRSTGTKTRGRILIYSSLSRFSDEKEAEMLANSGIDDVSINDLPRGVLVGTVELHDCNGGEWHIRNPERLETPVKPIKKPKPVWFNPF